MREIWRIATNGGLLGARTFLIGLVLGRKRR